MLCDVIMQMVHCDMACLFSFHTPADPPKVSICGMAKQTVLEGSSVALQCSAQGSSDMPKLRWEYKSFSGKRNAINGREEPTSIGSNLVLSNVSKEGAGVYTCVAEEEASIVSGEKGTADVSLSVEGMIYAYGLSTNT